MSYKQTVLDIEDFIKLEVNVIDNLLHKQIPLTQRVSLEVEKDAYKNITDIIKENQKKGEK